MHQAAGVVETALAEHGETPAAPQLRAELAQTWLQLAQVLDWRVNSLEGADEEGGGEDGEDGEESPGAVVGREAEVEALRLEEIGLSERAAALYAELGPDHLGDRLQCVQYAAWTEQETGREEAGVARLSALIDELRARPEGVPEGLLERAQSSLDSLRS